MRQIIIDFGNLNLLGLHIPLHVYGYGLMMVLGFLSGIYLARWRARRFGENPDLLSQCGIVTLLFGIFGARLAYVIEQWVKNVPGAPRTLGEILNVTSGGLIYYGGLILATVAVLAYLLVKRLPMRRYLDILAPSIMLGLAFGRAGCLLNGCCYGAVCAPTLVAAAHFPMYSQPLIKMDGRTNPFSYATESPSPVYGEQFSKGLVSPDSRLTESGLARLANGLSSDYASLRAPREFHGQLRQDQLATLLGSAEQARRKFSELAGPLGEAGLADWNKGLAAAETADGFLRGSEDSWKEALQFDYDRNGRLNFDEAWAYLQSRRQQVTRLFDADRDGELNAMERQRANNYLQADLYELAAAQRARPVKPSQALGIINAALLAALLMGFSRLRRREGQVFALMAILYPLTRFFEELIRDDNPHNLLSGQLTHNQYTSLIFLIGGIVLMLALRRMPASAGPAYSARRINSATAAKATLRK